MITVPSKDILDRFEATYFRKEESWLFPCYRLGFISAMDSDISIKCGQIKCQESLIAFHNGYSDALVYLNGRVEVERAIQVPYTTKPSTKKKNSLSNTPSTKEYTPPF